MYKRQEYKRGDIYLANLDPVIGVEQAGTRPVVIVQSDVANPLIHTVLVAPLTSSLRAGRFLLTITIPAQESGLPRDSVALLFQIRTLDKTRLVRRVGRLSDNLMEKVDLQIVLAFELEKYLDQRWIAKIVK